MRNIKSIQENPVCQDCKWHGNHPGTCNFTNKFMGRKQPVCDSYKMKKGAK